MPFRVKTKIGLMCHGTSAALDRLACARYGDLRPQPTAPVSVPLGVRPPAGFDPGRVIHDPVAVGASPAAPVVGAATIHAATELGLLCSKRARSGP
jgi:hypothetical protein